MLSEMADASIGQSVLLADSIAPLVALTLWLHGILNSRDFCIVSTMIELSIQLVTVLILH